MIFFRRLFTSSIRSILKREDVTNMILEAKRSSKLKFEDIASRIGKDKVWTTAAILGQHAFEESDARCLVKSIGLDKHPNADELIELLQDKILVRGTHNNDWSQDPVVTRLNELVRVYGPAIKLLINEMTESDGIVSAIDCRLTVDQYSDNNGNRRIKLVVDGKFLEYKKW